MNPLDAYLEWEAEQNIMQRPILQRLPKPWPQIPAPGCLSVTMSPGQKWDGLLNFAYESGAYILEVVNERVIEVYRKQPNG